MPSCLALNCLVSYKFAGLDSNPSRQPTQPFILPLRLVDTWVPGETGNPDFAPDLHPEVMSSYPPEAKKHR